MHSAYFLLVVPGLDRSLHVSLSHRIFTFSSQLNPYCFHCLCTMEDPRYKCYNKVNDNTSENKICGIESVLLTVQNSDLDALFGPMFMDLGEMWTWKGQ